MSANAHTAVMTDLEQRIQDGRQLSAPRPRINRIMEDRFYGQKPRVDIQRAVLFTQSMMQTEAYPQVLRTALAIQYMMEHIEVVIQPHELIVGTAGGPGRYCVLYPETRGGQFPRDLPKILKAEGKAGYAMTQAEVDTVLNEVVPYWKGKTSHELYLNMLPRETRRVIYGDEEYATQGLIFDEANNAHTLSWTGSYEKVIREGLESIIRELEERKAGIEGNLLHNQMDKIYYLDAAILSCKAMITYAHRYADRAEAMAAEESDPVRRAELETIAEICRHVPEHPARNFYEAVQAQWFLQVGYRLENMNGGGVGQVVTLLLGMNDAAVSVLTGDAADAVFYGVVQSSSRTLVETNSAEVQQAVSVMCTDGTARTVNVNNKLNFPAGKLVEISVDGDGESVQSISPRSTSGTVSADGTALGDTPFADNVQIIDTTSEGVAGAVRPSRLSGVTLSESDIRYYTTNSAGQIDRVILDDVTGDLWEYAALDSVRRLTDEAAKKIDKKISDKAQDAAREAAGLPAATTTTTTKVDKTDEETFQDVKNILVPSTSDVLYGLIDGSVVSSTWNTLTGKTDQLFSYVLRRTGDSVGGTLGDFLNYLGEGATYVCYSGGKQVAYSTATKYPVIAGGIAIGRSADGKAINRMLQLSPVVVDKLGAASVMSGDKRYETADDMQVYLWSNGQYFATSLPKINTEDYKLIGWYDNFGCTAGKKVRVIIAVKND